MGYREGVERVEPRIFCKIESKEEERGGRSIIGQTIALWYLLCPFDQKLCGKNADNLSEEVLN